MKKYINDKQLEDKEKERSSDNRKCMMEMINDFDCKKQELHMFDAPSFLANFEKSRLAYDTLYALQKWFVPMELKRENQILPNELKHAYKKFQNKEISDASCKFIVRLFDFDSEGGIDTLRAFESLYFHLKDWVQSFNIYDRMNSGYLDVNELDYALRYVNVQVAPDLLSFLITRQNRRAKKMSRAQYIIICIQIQRMIDEYKKANSNWTGPLILGGEDFVGI